MMSRRVKHHVTIHAVARHKSLAGCASSSLAHGLSAAVRSAGALSGKRVLELGSGTGVAGLAAALLGAQVCMMPMRCLRCSAVLCFSDTSAASGSSW